MAAFIFDPDELCDKIIAKLESRLSILQRAAQENPADDIINVDQAAEITHRAKQTIYGLACRGEIPTLSKKGRKLLFSRRALIAWLDTPKEKAHAAA